MLLPTMRLTSCNPKLLVDLIARYSPHVDYLVIRLEEAEGTDILLRGDKVET
jgi:TldD protein